MSLCKGTSLRNSNNLVTSSDLCNFLKPVWWPKKCSKTGTGLVFQMDSTRYLNNFSHFCFVCLFSPQVCLVFLPLAIQAFLLKTHLSLKLRVCCWKVSALGTACWGCVPSLGSSPWEFLFLSRDETPQAERCLIPLDVFNSWGRGQDYLGCDPNRLFPSRNSP